MEKIIGFAVSGKYKKLIVVTEVIVLVIAFVVGFIRINNYWPGIKNAIQLATTVKPETFTELYFENHTNLPTTTDLTKLSSFTFTIHNLEYQDKTYPYEVYFLIGDQKTTIQQSSLSIKDGGYASVNVSFLPIRNERTKVVVELTDKKQQIDFWLEKI